MSKLVEKHEDGKELQGKAYQKALEKLQEDLCGFAALGGSARPASASSWCSRAGTRPARAVSSSGLSSA
jgi:hypothetical protein